MAARNDSTKNYKSKRKLRGNLGILMNTEHSLEVVQKRPKYSKPLLPKSSQTLLQNFSMHCYSQKEK